MKAQTPVNFIKVFLCLLSTVFATAFSWGTVKLFYMVLELSGFSFVGALIFIGLLISASIAIKLWVLTFTLAVLSVIHK